MAYTCNVTGLEEVEKMRYCAYWWKNKDILILGEEGTQGSDDATLTAEAKYSINFVRSQRKFCLSVYSSIAKWGYQDNFKSVYLFIHSFIYFLQKNFTRTKTLTSKH